MFNKKLMIMAMLLFGIILIGGVGATDYYKSGNDINLTISCDKINCSDGDINLTVLSWDNVKVVDDQNTTKFNGYFQYTLNLTDGIYYFYIASDNGTYTSSFISTESGVEITEGRSNLAIGLILILVFLLFISLYFVFSFEHYIGKFIFYWVTHILLLLITFSGWQMGVEGLLSGMALTGIFRILFYFFTLAVFPMMVFSGVWIFYIHAFNEHFQKLLDKGEDGETAFRMAKEKRGGWIYGKR